MSYDIFFRTFERMQYIDKNTTSTLCLTLTENVTLQNPYFLFELRSKESNVVKYFLSANQSHFIYRYDLFYVTEVPAGSEDPLNSKINLASIGEYNYRVWEQTSASNLDPQNAGALLETGMFIVREAAAVTEVHSSINETLIVHNIP